MGRKRLYRVLLIHCQNKCICIKTVTSSKIVQHTDFVLIYNTSKCNKFNIKNINIRDKKSHIRFRCLIFYFSLLLVLLILIDILTDII